MNIHEYQAKQLFKQYGLPVAAGAVITSIEEIPQAIASLTSDSWVVKAQAHAGGRGKAGAIKLTSDVQEAIDFATLWLGKRLVTYQTSSDGCPVNCLLIEDKIQIAKELYLGAVIDRSSRKIAVMASTEGGVEIETVANATPEKILKAFIDPTSGAQPYQAREMAFALGLNGDQIKQFTQLFSRLVDLIIDKDLALVEINPLVITNQGSLHCLDAKINIDSNALFRQPDLLALRDQSQEDAREAEAAQWGLNYVALDGDIGCMVNGAGLAMGTMDIIKLNGGSPANFLDVGGGANKERVAEALKLILSDSSVKSILINIFGGIVRCDMIAEGILGAVEQEGVKVPIIVRLQGTNAKKGSQILSNSKLNILSEESLSKAAKLAVTSAG